MRKIAEVLRLRAAGMSLREISTSVNVGRTTVAEYLQRADAAGITWPLPEGLDDAAVEEQLFPAAPDVGAGRPVPDWREVHRELKSRRHVTLRLLWLEWREANPEGWAYSQYCWHYRQWQGAKDVVMRLSYAAGERMFVDYAGDKARYFDPDTGGAIDAEVFVSVLGCSGLLYVEATRSQDLSSWIGAHINAFETCFRSRSTSAQDSIDSRWPSVIDTSSLVPSVRTLTMTRAHRRASSNRTLKWMPSAQT